MKLIRRRKIYISIFHLLLFFINLVCRFIYLIIGLQTILTLFFQLNICFTKLLYELRNCNIYIYIYFLIQIYLSSCNVKLKTCLDVFCLTITINSFLRILFLRGNCFVDLIAEKL